jgi:hypothetical protein
VGIKWQSPRQLSRLWAGETATEENDGRLAVRIHCGHMAVYKAERDRGRREEKDGSRRGRSTPSITTSFAATHKENGLRSGENMRCGPTHGEARAFHNVSLL